MKSNSEKVLQHHVRAFIVTGILLLGSLAYYSVFQADPVYAMLPPGGYVMWSDVTAIGDEYQYDHANPHTPYIVGMGCTEYGYPDGDYSCYVTTTVTGPNGSSQTYSSYPNTSYSITHVYLRMTGALGRYNVDSLHYSISSISGGEEYLGCTHTFVDVDDQVDLYYQYNSEYYFNDPNGVQRKACVFIPCPSNQGKLCASSSNWYDYRNASDSCPKGIRATYLGVKGWFWTKCKLLSHADLGGFFTCP